MATSIFKADRVGKLSDLSTDAKTNLVAAINEVDSHADNAQGQVSDSNDAFDPTRPYKVGELCIYNNVLYRCITACSAGSWATNQSCFTADTLVNAANTLSDTKLDSSKLNSGSVLFDVTSGSRIYGASDVVGGIFPTGTLNNYVAIIAGFYKSNDATANISISNNGFLIQATTAQRLRITYIGVI